MEWISSCKTIQVIATDQVTNTNHLSHWKWQLDATSESLSAGKQNENTGDSQFIDADLFQ